MSRRNRLFLAVLLLAAGLRLIGITADSFWLDESFQSMSDAVGQRLPDFQSMPNTAFLFKFGPPRPVPEVLANFQRTDPLCPPLYSVLLNRWMSIFGESDLAVRSLSAVLSCLGVTAMFVFCRKLLGFPTAICASLIQAVSPFDIYYAQEARMYELVALCAAISSASLFFLLSHVIRLWQRILLIAAASISTWGLINAHYTGLFVVAFQALFGVRHAVRKKDARVAGSLIAVWLVVLLLWLPWLHIFKDAASMRTAQFFVARPEIWWWPAWALLARLPFNWISFLSGKQVCVWAAPVYATSALMLFSGVLTVVAWRRDDGSNHEHARITHAGMFVLCWLLIPALLIWLLDSTENHRVIEFSRYVMGTAPAAYMLAGIGLVRMWVKWPFTKWFLLGHLLFAFINNAYAHEFPQREPWKQLAAAVDSRCRVDDLILVSQYYDIVCLDRYLTRPYLQAGISSGLSSTEVEKRISGRSRFWLVTAQEGEMVKYAIPAVYHVKDETNLRHGLHLRLYERE